MNILVFSGTSDGNEIIEILANYGHNITVSVATEYGKELVVKCSVNILSGRLNQTEIQQVIFDNSINYVIDATHPYAVEVSKNISQACDFATQNYDFFNEKFRLLREQSLYDNHVVLVDSIGQACKQASVGNVLATTGSKQIAEYVDLQDYQSRLYARVLPTEESVLLCKNFGLQDFQIIQSLGVLSVEENINVINELNIKNLITKDGGEKGGFPQKSEACRITNTNLFVIKRPNDFGLSIDQICKTIGEPIKSQSCN